MSDRRLSKAIGGYIAKLMDGHDGKFNVAEAERGMPDRLRSMFSSEWCESNAIRSYLRQAAYRLGAFSGGSGDYYDIASCGDAEAIERMLKRNERKVRKVLENRERLNMAYHRITGQLYFDTPDMEIKVAR